MNQLRLISIQSGRRMEMTKEKWAVIDIGSNTIRLVIYAKILSGSYKEAENIKTVARLNQYLNQDNDLSKEGIALLIDILQGFKEILAFHQVTKIHCTATATVRQSKNQVEIQALVKEKTGFDMKILSEKEEAFFGYYAVSHSTPIDTGVTIDMGGGSTEITYFENRKLIHYHSFPFGVVSLKKQFIKNNPITEQERKGLSDFIQDSLKQLPWLKNLQVPVIAIGGSARNIAQIDQTLKKYPIAGIHQYVMSYSDLQKIQMYLGQLTIEQLEKVEGLSKDRADIIVPALEVFVGLCEYSQSFSFMFSKKGLRDGISLKTSETDDVFLDTDQIVQNSVAELLIDYGVAPAHASHRAKLAEILFEKTSTYYHCENKQALSKFVKKGAELYYLGQYIDDDSSSQHTFYLLANQSINGLFHKDRLKLAYIASFKNKTLLKQYFTPFSNWFTKKEMEDIRMAGAVAKLATALDASKRGIVKNIHFEEASNDLMQLTIYCEGNPFVEQYETEKHIRQLEKVLQKAIHLKFIQYA
ncbi:Ppx/GppA family phosphatase [Niallia endozanthoxylica]|uniref:Ppx/GppA family phosphatase n=2 Tax=Niallia endozanthoxylica TaxID=2036016 RepID=A0A5J5HYB4_9BACI|nr:Ppx/GppA family phosphatase [Niallia endozanthoxylica]